MGAQIRINNHTPFIDVSGAQRDMDHAGAQRAGVKGAWIKSTEGATYTSKYARTHAGRFAAVWIDYGFYHYATPHRRTRSLANDARDEAEHFGRLLAEFPGARLRPMLDFEERFTRNRDDNTLWVLEFAIGLAEFTDVRPALYCGSSFWRNRFHHEAVTEVFGAPVIAEYPWGLTHNQRRKRAEKKGGPRAECWGAWQWTSKFKADWTGGNIDLIAVPEPCKFRV